MPSNETLELLESVLSEAGAREKYARIQLNKAEDAYDKANELAKHPIRNFNKLRKTAKEENKARDNYIKYTTGNPDISNHNLEDIHQAGKMLKVTMNNTSNANLHNPSRMIPYINKVEKSRERKKQFNKDFGGPEADENSIMNPKHIIDGSEWWKRDKTPIYINPNIKAQNKELLKERLEKAKNNPHRVIGGYKLEAMYTITEALDKVLNEYEYDEDGANIICESSSILIEALNTLLNE